MQNVTTPLSGPASERRFPLGRIHVSGLDLAGALARIDTMITSGDRGYVCFCESNLFVHADQNPELAGILGRASMVLPDGVFLMALARLLGRPLPERLPGPSFILNMCEHGLAQGYRHFFYGGGPGIPERLAENLSRRYPGLQIAGTYSPPFRPLTAEEELQVQQMIEMAQPDLLWVGLGAPKQEYWMAGHQETIKVPVMLGVGAAFDFHAGEVPWAPRWIRRLGIEWAYRTLTGGRRIFRRNLYCLSRAMLVLVRELCK